MLFCRAELDEKKREQSKVRSRFRHPYVLRRTGFLKPPGALPKALLFGG